MNIFSFFASDDGSIVFHSKVSYENIMIRRSWQLVCLFGIRMKKSIEKKSGFGRKHHRIMRTKPLWLVCTFWKSLSSLLQTMDRYKKIVNKQLNPNRNRRRNNDKIQNIDSFLGTKKNYNINGSLTNRENSILNIYPWQL